MEKKLELIVTTAKEKQIVMVQAENLMQIADGFYRKYGAGIVVAQDYDKGILILSNGTTILDVKQNRKFKEMKKYM